MLATLSACSGDCSPLRRSKSSSRCECLCLLWDSGPIILRRSLYRATANYDVGYPLYCENELAPGDPVDFKISPFGGKSLQIFYVGGAASFGGPSYFPPKVRLLVLPLRSSHSMSSLVPFSHVHAHALRGWTVLMSC